MSQTCPKCGFVSQQPARFCPDCGTAMAATMVQGRTVVLPRARPTGPFSNFDPRTIIDRVRTALGQTAVAPAFTTVTGDGQHEDTFLVLDHSGSMGEELDDGVTKLEGAIRAGVNLVLQKFQLDPKDRIGVIEFSSTAALRLPLSQLATDKRQIVAAIQQIAVGGGTDINTGFVVARKHYDWARADVVRRLVLLTDGHGGNPVRTSNDLRSKGVVIDVIGVGPSPSEVKENLLRKIASVQNGRPMYRFIKDHRTLVQHFTQLANKTTVVR